MNTLAPLKKITLASVKKFIRENKSDIYLEVRTEFNGMTDGIESVNDTFTKVELKEHDEHMMPHTLGIEGAWFVGQSRDYFEPFESDQFTGVMVHNSCGSFNLAIKK